MLTKPTMENDGIVNTLKPLTCVLNKEMVYIRGNVQLAAYIRKWIINEHLTVHSTLNAS
jgi:hypothetical protein